MRKSKNGKYCIKRKASRKKFKASLLRMKEWLKANRRIPIHIDNVGLGSIGELTDRVTIWSRSG